MCIDHYRENYREKAAQAFRDVVDSLNGSFDESVGRVYVILSSKVLAERFHLALEKAKSVYELKIWLHWDTSYNDFKGLRDALHKTNIGVLDLRTGGQFTPSGGGILNRSRRHDPIIDIMRYPNIRSFTLHYHHSEFFSRSNLSSRNDIFSNLRYLELTLNNMDDVTPNFTCLFTNARYLDCLTLNLRRNSWPEIYNVVWEHQVYPIAFKDHPSSISTPPKDNSYLFKPTPLDRTNPFIDGKRAEELPLGTSWMRILPPTDRTPSTSKVLRTVTDMVRYHGKRIEALAFGEKVVDESEVGLFISETRHTSVLKGLTVKGTDQNLGEKRIKAIATLVGNSKLHRLDLHLEYEGYRAHILRSIPWNHIRELAIGLTQSWDLAGILDALAGSMKKEKLESVELECFKLYGDDSRGRISPIGEEGDLASILSCMRLKCFELDMSMTSTQVAILLESVDVSRLQHFVVDGYGFDSEDVRVILDALEHALELQTVSLYNASISNYQVAWAKAAGFALQAHNRGDGPRRF